MKELVVYTEGASLTGAQAMSWLISWKSELLMVVEIKFLFEVMDTLGGNIFLTFPDILECLPVFLCVSSRSLHVLAVSERRSPVSP